MSDLFSNLSMAARALQAQQLGLEVTGHNIANVNTPGFSRRNVVLAAVPPADTLGAGAGVEVTDIQANRDALLERRLLQEKPGEQREAALREALAVVEIAIGTPGQSLDASMARFFDAFARLAEDPISATARFDVTHEATQMAAAFNEMSQRLDVARRDADAGIRATVGEVNDLLATIASLNGAIGRAAFNQGETLALEDEQAEAVRRLSESLEVSVLPREPGGVDVYLPSGRPLVVGETAHTLATVPSGPLGLVTLTLDGVDVTADVQDGRIGGLLHARDVAITGYIDRLDTLAFTLATEVNTLHDAGFDLDGNDAGVFFVAPAGQPGAAAALAIDPAVVANSRLIAAAGAAAAGDNQAARAIADLRDLRVLDAGTATMGDAFGQLVSVVGRDAATARQLQATQGDIVRQLENLRDAVSGVSLDDEAVMLIRFQRAYEANARFFQVVDDTIGTLMRMVGA